MEDEMEIEIKYDDNGKPTKDSMKRAFEYDKELFLDLQAKHFSTKGTMGDGGLKKFFKDLMRKEKKEKKEED
jgi:hypothetical protein|tara:strand:- start:350 stop:565 length:216 start_codon:yes stop_codon:yes gene_type:complete